MNIFDERKDCEIFEKSLKIVGGASYKKPTLRVINLDKTDVIATSGKDQPQSVSDPFERDW